MNKNELSSLVKEKLDGFSLVVVSNREPYIHVFEDGKIVWEKPTSGLVVSLDPVMRACGGVWVAYGSGHADKFVVDSNNELDVPPNNPSYKLKRVWMTEEEEDGYYNGFCNQTLWPLCHVAHTQPIFNEVNWQTYKSINQRFADVVCQEISAKKAFVFIQDYHFSLLPRMIKTKLPNALVGQFWHVPWPSYEAFRICPWQSEILDGILGNDLLGFHIRYHTKNFLDTVSNSLESKIDFGRQEVIFNGKATLVREYPISVDFELLDNRAATIEIEEEMKNIIKAYNLEGQIIAIGVDRVDYTKGIKQRFWAIDKFLEKNPEFIGKFTFINLGGKSRPRIAEYRQLTEDLFRIALEINAKYTRGGWVPIIFNQTQNYESKTLTAFNRLADICIVSPLHDGMNLVAKEYVSSQIEENGVLILSKFTGSAKELTDAILINPYSVDEFSNAIKTACVMSVDEKKKRMKKMRDVLRKNNIYQWAYHIISDTVDIFNSEKLLIK